MNRADFLKTLGLGAIGLLLPPSVASSQAVKIYDNFIRGTHYYHCKKILASIKQGDQLQLKREHDNAYDSFAIEVYFQGYKLGYIAAYENIVLANMLDKGANLFAFVSVCNTSASTRNPIAIEVYVELISPTQQVISALENVRADEHVDIYRRF